MPADDPIQPPRPTAAGEPTPPRTLELPGDVDAATGDVAGAQDVLIHGSVVGASKVSGGGDVIVKGALEDAYVRAGRDLTVAGGIVGKD
jgi:uncharacterized protein (DUF342 family)